jgi:hypothetical protein
MADTDAASTRVAVEEPDITPDLKEKPAAPQPVPTAPTPTLTEEPVAPTPVDIKIKTSPQNVPVSSTDAPRERVKMRGASVDRFSTFDDLNMNIPGYGTSSYSSNPYEQDYRYTSTSKNYDPFSVDTSYTSRLYDIAGMSSSVRDNILSHPMLMRNRPEQSKPNPKHSSMSRYVMRQGYDMGFTSPSLRKLYDVCILPTTNTLSSHRLPSLTSFSCPSLL